MGIPAGSVAVAGIVLAAGRSRRMGEPKALLRVDGRTFMEAAVETLRAGDCDPVVVVIGDGRSGDASLPPRLRTGAGATGETLVVRADPASEQVDSLRRGLRALRESASAAVVLPVDHPLVRPETVRALIEAGRSDPDAVVRPVFQGAPGHPTLFPRSLWSRLLDDALPRGARTVVDAEETRTVDVVVPDPGVLADVDTPADYRRYVEQRPAGDA